jgi:hypothetical protein
MDAATRKLGDDTNEQEQISISLDWNTFINNALWNKRGIT